MNAHDERMRGLYGPTVTERTADLVEIADTIAHQMSELARDPTPERCQHIAGSLYGARLAVMKLGETIRREGRHE